MRVREIEDSSMASSYQPEKKVERLLVILEEVSDKARKLAFHLFHSTESLRSHLAARVAAAGAYAARAIVVNALVATVPWAVMAEEHRHIDIRSLVHSQALYPYPEWGADTSAETRSTVLLHTLAVVRLEAASAEGERKMATAEHRRVIVAALSLSRPDHTASRNRLAALMAPGQERAPVVLRLPRSSL